jgi:hypothetical protein
MCDACHPPAARLRLLSAQLAERTGTGDPFSALRMSRVAADLAVVSEGACDLCRRLDGVWDLVTAAPVPSAEAAQPGAQPGPADRPWPQPRLIHLKTGAAPSGILSATEMETLHV